MWNDAQVTQQTGVLEGIIVFMFTALYVQVVCACVCCDREAEGRPLPGDRLFRPAQGVQA